MIVRGWMSPTQATSSPTFSRARTRGTRLVWILWWATVMVSPHPAGACGAARRRHRRATSRRRSTPSSGWRPAWLRLVIYVMMEIAVIGSDIQEVVGSRDRAQPPLLRRHPLRVGCLVTGVDTFTFLAVQYFGVRYLEVLIAGSSR